MPNPNKDAIENFIRKSASAPWNAKGKVTVNERFANIMAISEFSKTALRVTFWLIGHIRKDGSVVLNKESISKNLELEDVAITLALDELKRAGLITQKTKRLVKINQEAFAE